MALEPNNEKPKRKTAAKAAANGNGAAAGGGELNLLRSTLEKMNRGDLSARVELKGLSGDSRDVAELLNSVLGKLEAADRRKLIVSQEIDRALDGLLTLVRQGDLSHWNASSENADLAPLL